MKYEFVTRVQVNRNEKEQRQRTILSLGIAAAMIAMLIAVTLKNYAMLMLVVPMIYLYLLRKQMGPSVLNKDVCGVIFKNNGLVTISLQDSFYSRKTWYTQIYEFEERNLQEFNYEREFCRLQLQFNGTITVDNGKGIVSRRKAERFQLLMNVSEKTAVAIQSILNKE